MNCNSRNQNRLGSRMVAMASAMFLTTALYAQQMVVKGTVKDETGEPVIGANIRIKGQTNAGAVTDLNGNFSIKADKGQTLMVSYVGMATADVKVTNAPLSVVLKDSGNLEELVVVGYGTQKKSVVTAAIAKVGSEDLEATQPVLVDNALQGLAAGVTVTAGSGAPGASSRVLVRGVGTINDSKPLFIVDGMPAEDGIDYLAPSDIESIEVLKDAASGAVYGARAANGVILVTTKSGKKGKTQVNYNFMAGWQSKWKKRDVLDATEYAVMMNEGYVNAGLAPKYDDPYSLGKGTDWQDEVFNDNAPLMSHAVNLSGATDKVNYYLSLNNYSQDGIVGGDVDRSNFRRLTLRSNNKYTIFDTTKDRSWLNKLTVTTNLSYARTRAVGVSNNTNSHGILNSALTLAPTLPVTYSKDLQDGQSISDAEYYANEYAGMTNYVPQYDANGNLYMVPGPDYDNQFNPVAYLRVPCLGSWNKVHKFTGNFAAELELGYGFKVRSSYGTDLAFREQENYTDKYYLTSSMNWGGKTNATATSRRFQVWQVENLLTWDQNYGKHGINVVLGQSAKKTTGSYVSGGKAYLVDVNKPYVNYATGHLEKDVWAEAAPYEVATLSSMFGRFSYNYDERYMLQGTVRRDGSSRFGAYNHYAVFPSFSAGWNIMNEKFMESSQRWLSKFKVRASWGKNGNESIGNFRYAAYTTSAGQYNTIFGHGTGNTVIGTRVGGLANPNLKWEESVQTDLGIDLGFFNGALTFTADYFYKKTNGMLMDMPIPDYVGLIKPVGNVGEMANQGVEFELGYKGKAGDFKYGIKGNLSYLHNELINLGNETGYMDYDNVITLGTITRGENGRPFPFFYGYKTNGIFQNEAEVQAYTKDGVMIQPEAKPGDFRFVDINNDGKIDTGDETMIGKGMPDLTFGLNLNAEWKGIDLNMFWQGTVGNDIYDATMRVDRQNQNLPGWMLGRWTGEGTSNSIPRYVLGNASNLVSSDMYVTDASYLRLKNIQLGYTLPQKLTKKCFISKLRVYVMASNLLTFTKYQGYDPEISSGGTSLGVDYGVYPQARTWSIGANVNF